MIFKILKLCFRFEYMGVDLNLWLHFCHF
uniref:Uncharacterized protein n=1 Tax=Anguilla anguilla TaxID=7936 RepID=A0A0E9VYB4_ANGAN